MLGCFIQTYFTLLLSKNQIVLYDSDLKCPWIKWTIDTALEDKCESQQAWASLEKCVFLCVCVCVDGVEEEEERAWGSKASLCEGLNISVNPETGHEGQRRQRCRSAEDWEGNALLPACWNQTSLIGPCPGTGTRTQHSLRECPILQDAVRHLREIP